MSLNLEKLAIVTANSKGIGKAITEELRKIGFFVPNISRQFGYDLMVDGIDKLTKDYPDCSVLVNNCGGMGRSEQKDWKDCMQKNYGTSCELTFRYLPGMINRGFGRVVTISSIKGLDYTGKPWFNAAKAAQIALNASLAGRYPNITFNTICPSYVNVREGETYKLNPSDVAKKVVELILSNDDGKVIALE